MASWWSASEIEFQAFAAALRKAVSEDCCGCGGWIRASISDQRFEFKECWRRPGFWGTAFPEMSQEMLDVLGNLIRPHLTPENWSEWEEFRRMNRDYVPKEN